VGRPQIVIIFEKIQRITELNLLKTREKLRKLIYAKAVKPLLIGRKRNNDLDKHDIFTIRI